MSSDAIVVLKADHKEIRNLFRKFQAAGDKAVKQKAKIVEQITELLTVHTYLENEVMYPEVCALLPDLKDDVLQSSEEHHVADVLCMELAGMPAGAERFDAKASVLIENVTHHIEEEEQDWFPKVRASLGRKQLQELGARLEQARKKAPRSPAQPSALKKTVDAIIRLTGSTPARRRRRSRARRSDACAARGASTVGSSDLDLGLACAPSPACREQGPHPPAIAGRGSGNDAQTSRDAQLARSHSGLFTLSLPTSREPNGEPRSPDLPRRATSSRIRAGQ